MNTTEMLQTKFGGVIHDKYPDYIITNIGEIYSIRRNKFLDKTLRKRNPENIFSKYDEMVNLQLNGHNTTVAVHRLLATAFIPNPDNKDTVNHIDGNPSNNALSNLEWCTQSENSSHAHNNDLVSGRYTLCSRSNVLFREVEVARYESVKEAAIAVATSGIIPIAPISNCATKNNNVSPNTYTIPYTSYGYVWRYDDTVTTLTINPINYSEQDITKIEYKNVTDNPRYLVTVDGRIYDNLKSKWVKISVTTPKTGNPFLSCSLAYGKAHKIKRVARIVADAFGIHSLNIGHKDNNIANCHLSNLVPIDASHVARKVIAYKLEWTEINYAECNSITEMAAVVDVPRDTIADAICVNKDTTRKFDYTSDPLPAIRGGYVFRGLRKL